MPPAIEINPEFSRALSLLESDSPCVFITGKAGTGKSTLLAYFREQTAKQVACLAPTGVAAVNIHGQTIHSFFGFRPDITPEQAGEIAKRKRRDPRGEIYQQLDAMVIVD